ncbi:hypothetical protein ACFW9N_22335 [Streptomyces sp. NPDC059496]|uniref:hypothetical protein n=1 Tax=Streptomyces sp. NPDC059496 TaxID=3346851 RepID=UPI0036CF39EE
MAGKAAVAVNSVHYLAMPEWAAALDRYLDFMNTLLVASPERPGCSGDGTEA